MTWRGMVRGEDSEFPVEMTKMTKMTTPQTGYLSLVLASKSLKALVAEALSKMGTDHLPRLPSLCEAVHGGRRHVVSGPQPLGENELMGKRETLHLKRVRMSLMSPKSIH